MTAVTAVDTPPDGASAPNRRRWRRAAAIGGCALLLAAIGVGLRFWRDAATYAPLRSGAFFAPYGSANVDKIVSQQTDLGEEIYIKGPAGTQAKVVVALENDGSHDVTVKSIERIALIANIKWSRYVVADGGSVSGIDLPLRPFPASIPAHEQIRVVFTLRKPPCEPGGYVNLEEVFVHWHALGVDHTYAWQDPFRATFVGCPHYVH